MKIVPNKDEKTICIARTCSVSGHRPHKYSPRVAVFARGCVICIRGHARPLVQRSGVRDLGLLGPIACKTSFNKFENKRYDLK